MASPLSRFPARPRLARSLLERVELDEWQIDLKDIMPAMARCVEKQPRFQAVAVVDLGTRCVIDVQIVCEGETVGLKRASRSKSGRTADQRQ